MYNYNELVVLVLKKGWSGRLSGLLRVHYIFGYCPTVANSTDNINSKVARLDIILSLTPSSFMANKMTGAERKKKFYERSRTGCATCKQRRVRCDEERPKW
jgi:hypothetical protein